MAEAVRFDPIQHTDPVVNRIQRNLEDSVNPIVDLPPMSGQILTDVAVATGSTVLVEHKLGRAYRGWVLVDNDTACTIHRDDTSTADTTLYLPLVSSATTTVDLWVF